MARSTILVLLLAFCLLAVTVSAKKTKVAKKEEEPQADHEQDEAKNNESENEEINNDENASANLEKQKEQEAAPEEHDKDQGEESQEAQENHEEEASTKEAGLNDEEESAEAEALPAAFKCNLKYQRVGCYKDKGKAQRPLRNYIMSHSKFGLAQKKSGKAPSSKDFDTALPEFACKCANEALDSGSAVFGIQNLAECWSGPDNAKFDSDGPSADCVTFGYKECLKDSALCAGKKHANFVYFVDSPDHTKSNDEAKKEWAEIKKAQKKLAEQRKKNAKSSKSKKSKKSKKASKKHH